MADDIGVAIVASLASGGFALLGVGVSNRLAARNARAAFRTETALELAGMEPLVWGDNFVELHAHIQRQQARMAVGGVREDLVEAFREVSIACWHDLRDNVEQSAGEHPGISSNLIDARQLLHHAIRADLVREGSRASRRRLRESAIAAVAKATDEIS